MKLKFLILIFVAVVAVLAGAIYLIAFKPEPSRITYGMSFNTMYAEELGLDWRETYDAILNDLGVKHLRLAAHWPMVESSRGTYNFEELDYQIDRAEESGADVILAVGRRLPRWPECHLPEWSKALSWEEQKEELRDYIEVVVSRYKERSHIIHWQVENEPYLSAFAFEHCGKLDEKFLIEEIELVRELDPTRPILVTDSGNLGTWIGAYKHGDAFGTSVYVYFWNPELGQFKSILPPWWYRFKEGLLTIVYGPKPTYLIELAAEPWLLEPVTEVSVETQYSRMDLEKINEVIDYASETRYDKQYLWGAEWWYWLLKQGDGEIWERGKELFR
jgi:hypothetical protein